MNYYDSKSPQEIAAGWYLTEEIWNAIRPVDFTRKKYADSIPTDVRSREFAEWLTGQYRAAMEKGIQLARGGDWDRLRQIAACIDNPEVLIRIPQPHRIKLSQLLHGAEQFCEDCGEPLEPGYIGSKCPMCEEDERNTQRST